MPKRTLLPYLLSLLLSVSAGVFAQTPIELSIERTLPTPEFRHGILMPIKCDPDGNIYFRGDGSLQPDTGALQRLSGDGKTLTTIETETGDLAESHLSNFDVSPDGTLFAIMTYRTSELVEFDDKGQIKRHFEISAFGGRFDPQNFVAFSPDAFLIAGRLFEKGGPGREFTALINGDGKLVREIKLPGLMQGAPTGPGEPSPGSFAMGTALVADDGNAYVLQSAGEDAKFYVISASGEVLRTLTVSSPAPKHSATQFGVAKGRLAVQFHQNDQPSWFRVVDVERGEEIATYKSELYGIFLCYSLDGFDYFVTNPTTKKFDLVRAVPQ